MHHLLAFFASRWDGWYKQDGNTNFGMTRMWMGYLAKHGGGHVKEDSTQKELGFLEIRATILAIVDQ